MNRSFKSAIWGVALIAAAFSAPALAELKIGVLDFGRLVDESPQGKALLESLRNEAATKQRELQATAQQLQAKQEKLTKDRATMTADQISRAEKELRDGQRDLARRQAEIQDDFNARRNEETSKLQRTLLNEVQTYARGQSFDLVITDGVIFANPALDITPAVLQLLQARAPAGAAAPASRPPATPAAAPRQQGGR